MSSSHTPAAKPRAPLEISQVKRAAPTAAPEGEPTPKKVLCASSWFDQELAKELQRIRNEVAAQREEANRVGRPRMVRIPGTNHLIWCPPTVGDRMENPFVETESEAAQRWPVLELQTSKGDVAGYFFDGDWRKSLVRRGDGVYQKKAGT